MSPADAAKMLAGLECFAPDERAQLRAIALDAAHTMLICTVGKES